MSLPLFPRKKNSGENDGMRTAMQYASLGTQLAAAVVGFGLVGYWLDSIFKTNERYTTIFLFLGAAGGLYSFIRTVIALGKKSDQSDGVADDASKVTEGKK